MKHTTITRRLWQAIWASLTLLAVSATGAWAQYGGNGGGGGGGTDNPTDTGVLGSGLESVGSGGGGLLGATGANSLLLVVLALALIGAGAILVHRTRAQRHTA